MIRSLMSLVLIAITSATGLAADGSFNLRVAPVWALNGSPDINLDYKVHDKFTVGPLFSQFTSELIVTGSKTTNLGLQVLYYDRGVFNDGFYAGLGAAQAKYEGSYKNLAGRTFTASDTDNVLLATSGYAWFWESFNVNVGLKLSKVSKFIHITDDAGNALRTVEPQTATGIDIKIGYVF